MSSLIPQAARHISSAFAAAAEANAILNITFSDAWKRLMATAELTREPRPFATRSAGEASLWYKDAIIYQLHVAHSTTATTTASATSAD